MGAASYPTEIPEVLTTPVYSGAWKNLLWPCSLGWATYWIGTSFHV